MTHFRSLATLVPILAGVVVSGTPVHAAEQDATPTPDQVVVMWGNTLLSQPGKKTRGFGGRLMFFAQDQKEPIKVDGVLTVYAYDITEHPQGTKPDRKYVFHREQFGKHYTESALGDSYNVWIPWGPVGGPQKDIELRVRFVSAKGVVIVSETSWGTLPGETPDTQIAAETPAVYPTKKLTPQRRLGTVRPWRNRAETAWHCRLRRLRDAKRS